MSLVRQLWLRGWRRIATHRNEAIAVGIFMVIVGAGADLSGLSPWAARLIGGAGVAGGLLVAFATVWLPIAVIDFRRCTRETALRHKVEADLERHAGETRRRQSEDAVTRSRCEGVLAAGGPVVVYQPIVEMSCGDPVGYEALSRFDDGVPPDAWFADAARVGLGVELELAAIARAMAALPLLPPDAYLSVNASPATLRQERLMALLAGAAPGRMVVELTEHVALGDYAEYRRIAAALGDVGARLAVDDAGAGYASLRHIVDLHPHAIKVDRSLVSGVHLDQARRSLMVALVSFARDLDATLIAEGVEVEGEEEVLRRWGLRFAQGWYYGRPAPLEALRSAVVESRL